MRSSMGWFLPGSKNHNKSKSPPITRPFGKRAARLATPIRLAERIFEVVFARPLGSSRPSCRLPASAAFELQTVELHDAALIEMVQQIRIKLLSAEVLVGLKRLALPGVDITSAKRTAQSALTAIQQGQLGYAVLIAAKSAVPHVEGFGSGRRPYDPMTRSASNAVFVVSPGLPTQREGSSSPQSCFASAAPIACRRLLLQRYLERPAQIRPASGSRGPRIARQSRRRSEPCRHVTTRGR